MSLAKKLRRARRDCGMTLAEVAEKVGKSVNHVWKLETGVITNPRIDTLLLLCRLYDLNLIYATSDMGVPSYELEAAQ